LCVKHDKDTFPLFILSSYIVDGKAIASKNQHVYLGVTLHETIQWWHHINVICNKASCRILNVVRRNLRKCSIAIDVKTTTYSHLTLACSTNNHACNNIICSKNVWDAHQQYSYLIGRIKNQRWAARWVLSDY